MTIISDRDLREAIVGAGFSVLVLFAIWSVGRRLRLVTVALALPTVLGHWTLLLSNSLVLRSLGFAIISVFLSFLTLVKGVTGQLYLAVLIARLVGMHTARVQLR